MSKSRMFAVSKAMIVIVAIAMTTQFTASFSHAQNPPAGNVCPNELLFSMGGFYYYGVTNCATNSTEPVIYIYDEAVELGCNTDGTCKCESALYGVVNQQGTFGGDKDKKVKKYKAVSVDDQLMTPFASANVSRISRIGDPKFVKVRILRKTRYFKVYNIRHKNTKYAIGVELNADPGASGKTVEDATFVKFHNNLVKIKVNGFSETVEAMFVN